MMRPDPKVLVVGAGLAGMATAIALEKRGINFDIVERASQPSEAGAGIFLPGNAAVALHRLGILDKVIDVAHCVKRQVILDANGATLHDMDAGAFWASAGPCLSLSRGALSRILRDHLSTPVQYGTGFVDAQASDDGLTAIFSDGRARRYRLVIGADGIGSPVRARLFGAVGPVASNRHCWRTIVPNLIGLKNWTVMLGHRRALLGIPIEDNRLYLYADADGEGPRDGGADAAAALRTWFGAFKNPFAPIIARLDADHRIFEAQLAEVQARDWTGRAATLIGDAAHASSPSMAQGAAMAFEDALVLARCLSDFGCTSQALRHFSVQRLDRVTWVQKQARARDATRSLPRLARNGLLRLAGDRLYRRSYSPLLVRFDDPSTTSART